MNSRLLAAIVGTLGVLELAWLGQIVGVLSLIAELWTWICTR